MDKKEAVEKSLIEIQSKYSTYFIENNLNIIDCTKILGIGLLSVHVTNETLPFEIKYEIETLLWV